jgi:hypothetical protein
VNTIAYTPSKPSWLHVLSGRLEMPSGDSVLVRRMVARGRRTVHRVVVLTPMPQLWFRDDDGDDDSPGPR